MAQSGALRGTSDTRFPSIVGVAGTWSAVVLGWLFLQVFNAGLPAVWAAFLVTTPVTALLMWRRLRARMARLAREMLV
jgi:Na+-driven multidrug efflux pump